MSYGTCNFVSKEAAARYYVKYYGDGAYHRAPTPREMRAMHILVENKIQAGEIAICKPKCNPGEWLTVIPGEGRYQINTPNPAESTNS